MLSKKELINYFEKGIKTDNNLKIGTEHEKFILNKSTLKPISYDEKNGIKDIFLSLINLGWKPIYNEKNDIILGLNNNAQNISLEPGGQLELSGAALENIHQTCDEITHHLKQVKQLSTLHNFVSLGIGVEPTLHLNEFSSMPKAISKIS